MRSVSSSCRRHVRGCAVLVAAFGLTSIAGPLAAGAPDSGQEGIGPAPSPGPNVPLGPSLFPLYEHYLRTGDDTEVRTILLYHSTERRDGTARSRLLLPFFYTGRSESPPDRRLYLFPFLFFNRSSPEESFTYSLPLFCSRRTPSSVFRLLFPFWWQEADREKKITSNRFLFPLAKHTIDESRPDLPESRFRLGIKYLLELFEAKSNPEMKRFVALNFFNWKGEAEGGLPLFKYDRSLAPDGVPELRSYLFPLYWRYDTADANLLVAGPFHGFFAGVDTVWKYYTPLVWWGEGEGDFRSLLLFPFFHRSVRQEPPLSSFASYPIFDWEKTPSLRSWGLFWLLYRNKYFPEKGKTVHEVLWPLGHFDVEPDGIKGHRRFLPFYFEDWDENSRLRFGPPLYWNYQTLAGGTWDWDFTLCLPNYIGWGAPRDYFATDFPLFWSFRSGDGGLDIMIPLYFRTFAAKSSSFYSLPLTIVRYPSQSVVSLLAGGATSRRYFDLAGASEGWSLNLLWWLWGFSRRPTGSEVRLLPAFWYDRSGEDRSILVFPLWYRQWGPGGARDFFFPVYGRSRSADGRTRRDFYALGTYAKTREEGEKGDGVRRRDDFLWSLLSFQEDARTGTTHQHFLPAGFWRTRSVNVDRTILGPFLYSHRIQEDEYTHRLSLFLGNLFLSKTVERDVPLASASPIPAPASPPPPPPAAGTGAPPTAGAKTVVSRESGVLWPLSRFGHDRAGNRFEWALPFYARSRTPTDDTRGFFPLLYTSQQSGRYKLGYFRYFFLLAWERFEAGKRFTFGQLLFDWLEDKDERRARLFYPGFQARWNLEGYSFQITPLLQGEKYERGGEKTSKFFLFPLLWKGSTDLLNPDGTYTADTSHFLLFPLYGVSRRSLRVEHDILFPFVNYRKSIDGFSFQLRPLLFVRSDAGERSVRLWPIHSNESGEGAGDWWVSRYLFFSKLALRQRSFEYRLDPFLFWLSRSPSESRTGGLFGLASYRRTVSDDGTETRWRFLPFAYGFNEPKDSGSGIFPLHYARDFGTKEIDYLVPWRFFFITNRLRGAEGRHFDLLWKLLEYNDDPRRPEFHDFRILEGFVVNRRTEKSRQISFNPFFSYIRDDAERKVDMSVLLSLYRYQSVQGIPRHTIFWIIRW